MGIDTKKVIMHVLAKEDDENVCAKCCKTKQIIERMLEEFPELKNNIEIMYQDVESKEITEKFGLLERPVVILNDTIFSEGHVPILKKLSREIITLLKSV